MSDVATLQVVGRTHAPVDYSKWFMPEHLTPLFFAPIYTELSEGVRLRYNQLHALNINEQFMFLEDALAANVIGALLHHPLIAPPLAKELRDFIEEETRHTELFRQTNRLCAPHLYADRDYCFIEIPGMARRMLDWISQRPQVFPFLIWFIVLQEERAVYYSREILRMGQEVEPHFVALHRLHLADEVGHVSCDEQVIALLWHRCPSFLRRINAGWLAWLVGTFFTLPKRAGLRVIMELVKEHPELQERLPELRQALLGLAHNEAYRLSIYSRAIVPKTFALMDAWPEFAVMKRVLRGYTEPSTVTVETV